MTLSDLRFTNAVPKAHARIAGDMYYDDTDSYMYIIDANGNPVQLTTADGNREYDSIEEALRSR